MSARDDIMANYEELRDETCVCAECVAACAADAHRKLDAYRAEVLREAADMADSYGHHWRGSSALALFEYAVELRRITDQTGETDE